tara:strand:+ start:221 stop:487 length:267 start_codon:yes stop_codon:yes gene_type:complete
MGDGYLGISILDFHRKSRKLKPVEKNNVHLFETYTVQKFSFGLIQSMKAPIIFLKGFFWNYLFLKFIIKCCDKGNLTCSWKKPQERFI